MSKLSELKKLAPEDLAGADPAVTDVLLPHINSFNEDVFNRINGDIGLVNTNNAIKRVKLVHGVEKIIGNPLLDKRLRPVGVYAIRSDGLPLAGSVQWRNIGAEEVGLTVFFDNSEESTGQAGEIVGPITCLRSAANGLATGTAENLCTTPSISPGPGKWNLSGSVGFLGAAATVYGTFEAGVSLSTGALPGTDTQSVPTAGEARFALTPNAGTAPGAAVNTIQFSYDYEATAESPLFLVARATFSGSTLSAFGYMQARRLVPYLVGLEATVDLYFVGG